MESKLKKIQETFLAKINSSSSLKELDEIFLVLFGKNGEITLLPKEFATLSVEEKKTVGPLFNQVKQGLEREIEKKRQEIRETGYQELEKETLDLEKPVEVKKRTGHLHQFEEEIIDIFTKLGFQRFDAPYIDSDYNNFEVLNLGPNHPARDLWDTLYIDSESYGIELGKLLLRTHTSNSQIHIMNNLKLPIRAMNIGNVFRFENLDARHEHTFTHFEIVYIDKGLSMANLQFLSEYLLKKVLGEDIKVRLSPGYYPFTEPSAHIFGTCIFCKGEGCDICGKTGELELGGAGMMHPQVLRNGGIDPDEYTGIAWGLGLERILMLKYGVNDVRTFRKGELNFIQAIGERIKNESK
jgi:phenylalanyl-tRNA synthetase alpha chain